MERLTASRDVSAPIAEVQALFWDIRRWHAIWHPIESIAVPYDDGQHQEFVMVLWRDTHAEQVRTLRFRRAGGTIHFFSPLPPPMMRHHRGAWGFVPRLDGCRILALREYELLRAAHEPAAAFRDRQLRFRTSFAARLDAILASFDDHFARHASHGENHEIGRPEPDA